MYIYESTDVRELISMLNDDTIPTNAPTEDLHAAILQLCKIVKDLSDAIDDIKYDLYQR